MKSGAIAEDLTAEPASPEQAAPRGRPREFDATQALSAALRVFWQRGYEGASLTELTEAMGITRPSLYACFGNKEALFKKALDLYEREKMAYVGSALEAPTARGVAERLLRGALAIQTSSCDPKGCLGVISSVVCGAEAESVRADVLKRRASTDAAMLARFERARDEGDLPEEFSPAAITRYLLAVLQGMAVQASSGACAADLETLVETTLAMWPGR
jgi:AcrR family transcriptional regulator